MILPKPTAEELQLGNKADYFNRIYLVESVQERNLDMDDLAGWVHQNYESVLHSGNEITYKEFLKSKR